MKQAIPGARFETRRNTLGVNFSRVSNGLYILAYIAQVFRKISKSILLYDE